MAARNTPSKGGKPDKLMRDALILELQAEAQDSDGVMTKKLRQIARKLVDKAIEGDVPAIKEINDRVDGKAHQSMELSGGLNLTHEEALNELDEPGTDDQA